MDSSTGITIPVADNLQISALCPINTFYLSGPGTGFVEQQVTSVAWTSQVGEDLVINVAGQNLFDLAGKYDVRKQRGQSNLEFTLVLCKLNPFVSPVQISIDLDYKFFEPVVTIPITALEFTPNTGECGLLNFAAIGALFTSGAAAVSG